MLDQLWRNLNDWLTNNRPGFWIGMAVATGLWIGLGLWLELNWWRRRNGRIIFGHATGLKYSWSLLSVLLLIALAVGIVNLLGNIAVFGGIVTWLLSLVIWFLTILILCALAIWLLRTRRLELDPAEGTWTSKQGWILSPHRRTGTYDDIAHLSLQELQSWRWRIWRIAVVWKDGTTPFRLFDSRLKRPSLPKRIFALLTGLYTLQTAVEHRMRDQAIKHLHTLGELTQLRVVDDAGRMLQPRQQRT